MILFEDLFNTTETIVESVGGDGRKKTYLSGIFMESGVKNRNGRIYDKSEMAIQVAKINEAAARGEFVLGELDHPNGCEIKLENVSHKIIQLRTDGDKVYGKAEVIEAHPKGQILKSLLDSGVRVGVSSRGTGQVNESTGIVKNFNLVTIDAVATPSCRTAFPETIREQLEMYKRGEMINELAEAVINDQKAQKYFQEEMRRFISTLYS